MDDYTNLVLGLPIKLYTRTNKVKIYKNNLKGSNKNLFKAPKKPEISKNMLLANVVLK